MPRHKKTNMLIAMGIGAGCMYLLDPVNGKRRRTRIRDKFVRLAHAVEGGTEAAARDLTNRTRGIAATVGRVFHHLEADAPVLEARVRSEMGRCVSHPHIIHVEARDGRVILSGDILAAEERDFLHHVKQIPGVKVVENLLRAHEQAEGLSILQGGIRREPRFEFFQTHWAPGPRLLAAVSGAAMMSGGIRSRGLIRWCTSIAGALLLVRAVTNTELNRLIGSQAPHRNPEAGRIKPAASGVSIPIVRKEPGEYRVH